MRSWHRATTPMSSIDLTDLVEKHPLWERFHAELILALFRCGRQSDASARVPDDSRVACRRDGSRARDRVAIPRTSGAVARSGTRGAGATGFHPSGIDATAAVDELRRQGLGVARVVDAIAAVVSCRSSGPLVRERRVWCSRWPAAWPRPRIGPSSSLRRSPTSGRCRTRSRQRSVRMITHLPGVATRLDRRRVRVIERLGDRQVIMILDNCEHVLTASGEFAQHLLAACPAVTIVATSRESLGVEGERQVTVGAAHRRRRHGAVLRTRRSGAAALFTPIRTPRSRWPICAGTSTAYRSPSSLPRHEPRRMPVPEIAARLHDRFELLVGTKRSGTGRQHGLRERRSTGAMTFSSKRSNEHSGGSPSSPAAPRSMRRRRCCGADALEIVARLVDKSLLVADTSGTCGTVPDARIAARLRVGPAQRR